MDANYSLVDLQMYSVPNRKDEDIPITRNASYGMGKSRHVRHLVDQSPVRESKIYENIHPQSS